MDFYGVLQFLNPGFELTEALLIDVAENLSKLINTSRRYFTIKYVTHDSVHFLVLLPAQRLAWYKETTSHIYLLTAHNARWNEGQQRRSILGQLTDGTPAGVVYWGLHLSSTVRRRVSFGLPLLCLPCLLPGFFQSTCPIIIIIIWTCFKVHHSMRFDEKTFQSISGVVQQSTCHGVTVLRKSTHFNSWFCVIRFSI